VDFNNNQDVTLALVTDGGVEHGVKCGLVLREAIKVNNPSKNIAELVVVDTLLTRRRNNEWRIFGACGTGSRSLKVKSNLT
jgi:hypothetical protein